MLNSYHNNIVSCIVVYYCIFVVQSAAELESQITGNVDYSSSGFSTVAYHAYDAVWTLAFGIDRYIL